MKKLVLAGLLTAAGVAVTLVLSAQQAGAAAPPAPPAAAGAGTAAPVAAPGGGRAGAPVAGRGGGRAAVPAAPAPAFPQHVTDPAAVERGRALYSARGCNSCHAADIRGTDNGPSLLREASVMQDDKGELIGPAIRSSPTHRARGFESLTEAQVADIAQFLHSFRVAGYDITRMPATFTVGDKAAGQTYFTAHCASCHAVATGASSSAANLAGIGARVTPERTLQQRWLSPSAQPRTAVVNLVGRAPVSGRVVNQDEFQITLAQPDGVQRSYPLDNGVPRVVVTDPLATHKALLRVISDDEIHNVTAYLSSLK